ncbi:MAG: alpha/beta hydrolase-fold protein [Candidatus Promineifilaceae bacterium]|nr:alpha/beta hydrolase-fold protein [Candidatus Promineifilaceae bacterium]
MVRKRPLILLVVSLFVWLIGCQPLPGEPSFPESASFPPEPQAPGQSPVDPNQTQMPLPQENLANAPAMPTAIAHMVGVLFAEQEPLVSATPLQARAPTATPAPTPCASPGQIVTGTYPSENAGPSAYRIYLPPCYQPNGHSYPTLYMLPGNIHRDNIWDNLGLDEAAEEAIQQGEITPLLIVMADSGMLLNNTSGGPFSYETQILEDLIPFIEKTYCAWADPRGRAIGGMSRGGYWALEIAFRNPEHFASVGGHSASLYDLYGGNDVVPQSTGLANDLGNLRMYFDVGENDWVIPNIRQLHEDMEAAGIAHEWKVNNGFHDDAYWASHTAEYIAWYAEPWPQARDVYPQCEIEK